ncbi:MAG: hypothetical protein KGH64_05305 [Candidatus Micrarchaeota archaeon]|nr:hypothetical protein [Candidatus Micrarchaeota archaeon]MDE1834726.1 hypothetical protein [Candidatus Micrarchaeota archaeon]MDE1859249.1 hypothetical protein [Candidatus Micrarchaeota archaeon]
MQLKFTNRRDASYESAMSSANPGLRKLLEIEPGLDGEVERHTQLSLLRLRRDLPSAIVDRILLNSKHPDVHMEAILHDNVSLPGLKKFARRNNASHGLKQIVQDMIAIKSRKIRYPTQIMRNLSYDQELDIREFDGHLMPRCMRMVAGFFTGRYQSDYTMDIISQIDYDLDNGRGTTQEAVKVLLQLGNEHPLSRKVFYDKAQKIAKNHGIKLWE